MVRHRHVRIVFLRNYTTSNVLEKLAIRDLHWIYQKHNTHEGPCINVD
jgi:hypothetical protein